MLPSSLCPFRLERHGIPQCHLTHTVGQKNSPRPDDLLNKGNRYLDTHSHPLHISLQP